MAFTHRNGWKRSQSVKHPTSTESGLTYYQTEKFECSNVINMHTVGSLHSHSVKTSRLCLVRFSFHTDAVPENENNKQGQITRIKPVQAKKSGKNRPHPVVSINSDCCLKMEEITVFQKDYFKPRVKITGKSWIWQPQSTPKSTITHPPSLTFFCPRITHNEDINGTDGGTEQRYATYGEFYCPL